MFIGQITDGDELPVTDACVEIWQADPVADEIFPGYGRAASDLQGMFRFVTIRPGPVPRPRGAGAMRHRRRISRLRFSPAGW